jgi:hypothetical protein
MVVSLIVIGGLTGIYFSTARTYSLTQTRLTQTNDARNGVETMSRLLRTAVMPKQLQDLSSSDAAFLSADYNIVKFYANIDNPNNSIGPSRVALWVNAQNELWEKVQPPDQAPSVTYDYAYTDCTVGAPGCKIKQILLAKGVKYDASHPVFKYYDTNQAQIVSTPISGSALGNIDSVEVELTVTDTNGMGSVAPTTYVERVALPNHAEIVREQNQASSSP